MIQIDGMAVRLPSDVKNVFNPTYALGGRNFDAGVVGLRDALSGHLCLPSDAEGNIIVTPGRRYNVVLVGQRRQGGATTTPAAASAALASPTERLTATTEKTAAPMPVPEAAAAAGADRTSEQQQPQAEQRRKKPVKEQQQQQRVTPSARPAAAAVVADGVVAVSAPATAPTGPPARDGLSRKERRQAAGAARLAAKVAAAAGAGSPHGTTTHGDDTDTDEKKNVAPALHKRAAEPVSPMGQGDSPRSSPRTLCLVQLVCLASAGETELSSRTLFLARTRPSTGTTERWSRSRASSREQQRDSHPLALCFWVGRPAVCCGPTSFAIWRPPLCFTHPE